MKLFKNYLFIIFTFLTFCGNSQNIDSLKNELKGLPIDTSTAKLYNQIAQAYTRSNLDSAELYTQKAFQVEEKLNYKRGLQRTWYTSALISILKNKPEEAIKKYKTALNVAEQINDRSWISIIANDLGVVYGEQGRLIEAIDQFQKVLTISQEIKDTIGISYALTNIGSVHEELGNEKKANEYLELSGIMGLESSNPYVSAISYSNLGAVAAYRSDTVQALEYEQKSLDIALKINDIYGIYASHTNIGYYSLSLKNYRQAKESFDVCLEYAQQIGDSTFLVNSYLNLSEYYLKRQQYNKAIKNASKALKVTENINGHGSYVADVREKLAEGYAGIENFKIAYQYLNEYKILNDSLVSKDNRQLIANMETLYKTNEKEKENEMLKQQNDKILKQQTIIKMISIFLSIAILALFIFGYNAYNNRKRNIKFLERKVEERTRSLKTANASLERFNYVASHDLKEPLRSIVSSTQLLERNLEIDEQNSQFMSFIKRDAKRLYELVNAMILVAKYKQIELKPVEVDLNESLYKTVKNLQVLLEQKNAAVEFENLPTIKTDASMVQLVFRQLLQNAIIFNESITPLVEITVNEGTDFWEVLFSDNGIGIDKEFHGKIFEAFKRLHHYDKYSGTGIGLFLAKDVIEMQGGTIAVQQNLKGGSTFIVTLKK